MPARVTVAILSHRPRLLPEAVRSVMAQTVPVQLLVQHDADNWPTKIHDVVKAARGNWLVPLCDDDALHPRYVERCLFHSAGADIVFTDRRSWWDRWEWRNWRSWVHRTPRTGKVFTFFPQIAALCRANGDSATVTLPREAFQFGSALPMTCMMRLSLWNDLGGYDNITHADTDLWYRAVKAGAVVRYIPEPLFFYRFHNANISVTQPVNGHAALDFHRKHFRDFGFAFTPRADDPRYMDCRVVPEGERA